MPIAARFWGGPARLQNGSDGVFSAATGTPKPATFCVCRYCDFDFGLPNTLVGPKFFKEAHTLIFEIAPG